MFPNKKLKINLSKGEVWLILFSLIYAGISSKVVLGLRAIDILIIAFFLSNLKKRINKRVLIVILFMLVSILSSTIMGALSSTPFLLSDLRFLIIFLTSIYSGYILGVYYEIRFEKVFYILIYTTAFIYLILPFFNELRYFYIPESFQKDEHKETIFGPSVVLINYIYIYLVLKNKSRPASFYITFIIFTAIIYIYRVSRTDLVLMFALLIWSLIYRNSSKIKIKHIVLSAIFIMLGAYMVYISDPQRITGILNPQKDSSFVYRLVSNELFINDYREQSIIRQVFGYGLGAEIELFINEWIGKVTFVLLDNGPLTILFKMGALGVFSFFIALYYPLKGLSLQKKIILLLPIVLSMALFSHIIYNLLYIFSFYLISFKLRSLTINNK